MFAENKVKPRIIWSFKFCENVRFFLKKKYIKGKVHTTVKKYLAQVIWKKDNSDERYFAIASIKGNKAHADKLRMIAFI